MEKTYRIYNIAWRSVNPDKEPLPESIELVVTDNDVEDIDNIDDIEIYATAYLENQTNRTPIDFDIEEVIKK